MVPGYQNRLEPFSSGVADDRSHSKDEDSMETKISNSDHDRVSARKNLA